jgi:hypothetical protein
MVNLSPRNVTSIEEGRAWTDEMLKRLAAVLGVDRRTEGLRSTFGARLASRWDGTLAGAPPAPAAPATLLPPSQPSPSTHPFPPSRPNRP